MFLEVSHVGVSLQEPQEFVDNTLQVELLRCQQWESVVKVITALCAEDADGASACAVTLLGAFRQDAVENVEILFHLQFYNLRFTIYLFIY